MIKGEEDEVKTSFPLESMKIEASFHKSLWHMDMKQARKRRRPGFKGQCIHVVSKRVEK